MKAVSIDTETTGLSIWAGARPFAVSMAFNDGDLLYWEWEVNPFTRTPIVKAKDIREINLITRDKGLRKTFFHAAFDIRMLNTVGVEMCGRIDEVSWMARAVDNQELSYALKPLSKKYIDYSDADQKLLHAATVKARRAAKKMEWNRGEKVVLDYWLIGTMAKRCPDVLEQLEIDPEVCEQYAIGDAERTIILDDFYQLAMDDLNVRDVYENEMKLWPTTYGMTERGVLVDPKLLKVLTKQCKKDRDEAEAFVQNAVGRKDFNLGSTQQMSAFLFGKKNQVGKVIYPRRSPKLTVRSYTKGGAPSVDADALMPYRSNDIVESILKYRANTKALTSFFQKYQDIGIHTPDGIVLHPGLQQWGTKTGRYTCIEPNLQQVSNPATTSSIAAEYVVDVRQIFIPRPGYVWYLPDYKQVEVVIFADQSGEPTMIQAIKNGEDIHTVTTEKVWGGKNNERTIPAAMRVLEMAGKKHFKDARYARDMLDQVNWRIVDLENSLGVSTWRKRAKSVTFTKIFGGGIGALMGWIKCSDIEAQEVLTAYDTSFPEMIERIYEIIHQAKQDGFLINPFGRRLVTDSWRAYAAVNHLVQSSAADLMKQGMRRCAKYLQGLGLDIHIILTVHDEIIFEFNRKHTFKRVLRRLCAIMSDHGGRFSIPTPVDIDRVSERWSSKEKVEL